MHKNYIKEMNDAFKTKMNGVTFLKLFYLCESYDELVTILFPDEYRPYYNPLFDLSCLR
jgi:hypothetical protein